MTNEWIQIQVFELREGLFYVLAVRSCLLLLPPLLRENQHKLGSSIDR